VTQETGIDLTHCGITLDSVQAIEHCIGGVLEWSTDQVKQVSMQARLVTERDHSEAACRARVLEILREVTA
jgi:hypothetical protein